MLCILDVRNLAFSVKCFEVYVMCYIVCVVCVCVSVGICMNGCMQMVLLEAEIDVGAFP